MPRALGPSSGTCGGERRALEPLHRFSCTAMACKLALDSTSRHWRPLAGGVGGEGSGYCSKPRPACAYSPAIFWRVSPDNVQRPRRPFGGQQPCMGMPDELVELGGAIAIASPHPALRSHQRTRINAEARRATRSDTKTMAAAPAVAPEVQEEAEVIVSAAIVDTGAQTARPRPLAAPAAGGSG